MEPLGGPVLQCRRAVEHHRQHQARPVRRPDHLLSGGGAGGPEPAVAQHPQLLPRLAIFVLSICSKKPKEETQCREARRWRTAAIAAGAIALAAGAARRAGQGDRLRPAVRPHRPHADRGHLPLPRLPRLHQPAEQQGRRRGLQDHGARDRQRVQGAAGHGGARALQEGGRGARGHLRHAADRGADQEAGGGQDPRHLAGLRHRRRRRRQALSLHLPDRRQLLVAGRRRGRRSPRSSSAAASRARRSPTCSTTTRPARSRSPSSRTSPRSEGFELRTFAVPAPGVEMARAGARHHRPLQARLRHRASVRPRRRRSPSRSSRARATR